MEDREGVERVVGGGQQIIAAVGLEHGWVAVAGEDGRRRILGQQRLPVGGGFGEIGRRRVEMRQPRPEVAMKVAEQLEIMLRLRGGAAGSGRPCRQRLQHRHGHLRLRRRRQR